MSLLILYLVNLTLTINYHTGWVIPCAFILSIFRLFPTILVLHYLDSRVVHSCIHTGMPGTAVASSWPALWYQLPLEPLWWTVFTSQKSFRGEDWASDKSKGFRQDQMTRKRRSQGFTPSLLSCRLQTLSEPQLATLSAQDRQLLSAFRNSQFVACSIVFCR